MRWFGLDLDIVLAVGFLGWTLWHGESQFLIPAVLLLVAVGWMRFSFRSSVH